MTATVTSDEILAKLQRSYDLVKSDSPHRLGLDDDITGDLDLDSLEFIDLVAVLEDEFPSEVIDAVIEQTPDMKTVGDLVEAFIAAATQTA
jgi:acyl carrier protein